MVVIACALSLAALCVGFLASLGSRGALAEASTPTDAAPTLLPLVPLPVDDKAVEGREPQRGTSSPLARAFRMPRKEARELPSDANDDDALLSLARALAMPGGGLTDPCRAWQGEVCVATALTPFFRALDDTRARRAPTRVSVLGNSLIVSDRIVDVWRSRMQARFGDGGRGFLLTDGMTTYSGRARTSTRAQGFTSRNVVFGPRGVEPFGVAGSLFVSREKAEAHFDVDGAARARVLWLDRPSAPRVTWFVDDRARGVLESTGDAPARRRAATTTVELPAGTRTLTLRTDEPGALVYGVDVVREEPGFVLDVMAVIGADATRHLRSDEDVTAAQLQELAPNLVTLLLGGNEVKRIAWGSSTRARVARDVRALIARVQRAVPDAACLVTGPLENVLGGQPVRKSRRVVVTKPFATRRETRVVNEIFRAAALEAGCAYLDLFAAMGEEGALRRLHDEGLLHKDKIHPTGRGLDLVGALIDDALIRRFAQAARLVVDDDAGPRRGPSPKGTEDRRAYTLLVDGERLVVRGEHGASLLAIPAVLDVDHGAGRERVRGVWAEVAPGVVVARAESARARVTFRVEADEGTPHLRTSVEVEYLRPIEVEHEVWTWRPLDGEGSVLDRGYRLRALEEGPFLVDRWTPHVARLRAESGDVVSLIGHDDFQGMRATRGALAFELDHEENHPHSFYEDCVDAYDSALARTEASRRARARGERASYAAILVVGDTALPVLARWPEGRRAAFTIVDHADRTTARSLRALLYGTSRANVNTGGLIEHDVRITQTVFATDTQLGDPKFRALVDEMAARGHEIAPHSITPARDSSRTIARALSEDFADYASRTWVDHQPQTNCEALNNAGARGERDVARAILDGGVRYAWEAPDFRTWDGLDLLRPHRPSMRTSVLYKAAPLHDDAADRLWLFRSAWQFVPRETFVARLKPHGLDALEASHGVHIAHTYLGFIDDDAPFAERTIFVREKWGALAIDRAVARAFAELGRRQQEGTLWVTPLGALGDWLARWSRARLVHTSATTWTVRHLAEETPDTLATYTLRALDDGVLAEASPQVTTGTRVSSSRPLFDDALGVRVMDARAHR